VAARDEDGFAFADGVRENNVTRSYNRQIALPPNRALTVGAGCNLDGVVIASRICRLRQRPEFRLRSNCEDPGTVACNSGRPIRLLGANSERRDNRRSESNNCHAEKSSQLFTQQLIA